MPPAYWRAVSLVGASLILELPLLFYVADPSRVFTRIGFIVGILVGLLLLSRIIRYLGALFLAGSAGYFLWGALSSKAAIPFVLSISLFASAVLQVAAAYLLVFSGSFSKEFEAREANAPVYLRRIRTAMWVLVGICAIYATANDIHNLAK